MFRKPKTQKDVELTEFRQMPEIPKSNKFEGVEVNTVTIGSGILRIGFSSDISMKQNQKLIDDLTKAIPDSFVSWREGTEGKSNSIVIERRDRTDFTKDNAGKAIEAVLDKFKIEAELLPKVIHNYNIGHREEEVPRPTAPKR